MREYKPGSRLSGRRMPHWSMVTRNVLRMLSRSYSSRRKWIRITLPRKQVREALVDLAVLRTVRNSLHRNNWRHSVSWRRPGSRLWRRAMLSERQLWISSTRRLWIVSTKRKKSWRMPIRGLVRKVVCPLMREQLSRRGETWKSSLTIQRAQSSLMER